MHNALKLPTAALLSAAMLVSSMPTCSVSADIAPNPVISRSCPVYCSSGQGNAANDEHYFSFWSGNSPDYLAYDLSDVPETERRSVIAAWHNATGQYDPSILNGGSTNGVPSTYTIEVNAAEGGTYPEDGWVVAESVEGNTLHSRQHVIDMEGYNWIRMNIAQSDGKSGGSISIQLDIHNISNGIADSWIFFGDSITACGMMNCYGTSFAELVNTIDSRYFPVQENGGIGGIISTDGKNNIDRWLSTFPGEYVSIAYGTNDAWGNQTGAEKYYENTIYMIEAILKLDKTPILPTIPYATESGVNNYLDDYNAMIHRIYEEYPEVVKGPDFDAFLREHPEYLSGDGVHPSSEGYAAMRQLWADTMYANVYTSDSGDCEPSLTPGDINYDSEIDVLDVILLQQYLLQLEVFNIDTFRAADYDDDGAVNAFDLAMLKRKIFSE